MPTPARESSGRGHAFILQHDVPHPGGAAAQLVAVPGVDVYRLLVVGLGQYRIHARGPVAGGEALELHDEPSFPHPYPIFGYLHLCWRRAVAAAHRWRDPEVFVIPHADEGNVLVGEWVLAEDLTTLHNTAAETEQE